MASLSGSIFTPSFGFSTHQLIMSRNVGNSWGWVSDAKGWHMAQAIPVLDSVTFIFFSVSPSPWNKKSPTLTCSMKTSWKAASWSGVCFSLWASAAGGVSARSVPSTSTNNPAATAPNAIRRRRFVIMTIPPRGGRLVGEEPIRDARAQDLVHVVAGPGVHGSVREDLLPPPHDVLVLHLGG